MLSIWGVNPVITADQPDNLISNHRWLEKSRHRKTKQSVSLFRSPEYLPISSIPDCTAPGLNYTFVSGTNVDYGGSLRRRQKEPTVSENSINPEQLSSRPKRQYLGSSFHRTPEALKNSAEEVVLTIDTRLDTNVEESEKDRER